MAEFDTWAAYYDFLHPGLPGEAEFFVGQAVKRGGPVLEIGCGTGRLAIPMALSGLKVTGLDNSAPMLSICEEKAKAVRLKRNRLTPVEADMRAFRLAEKFPLAIMAYRTFMHCLSSTDQLACLKAVRRHLVPGGELLCSLWAAQPAALAQFKTESAKGRGVLAAEVPVPGEYITLVHYVNVWRDDFLQILHERHLVREQAPDGRILHEERLRMTRAWITPREMEHLVYRAGFDVVAVLGDFNGVPLGPGHTEMVWHLRRTR
jgi:SAM-dependent methyltransferase